MRIHLGDKLTVGSKLLLCVIPMLFGVAVLATTRTSSEYSRMMDLLAKRGKTTTGNLIRTVSFGGQLPHDQLTYSVVINGKPSTHQEYFYYNRAWSGSRNRHPGNVIELTYLPEDPSVRARDVAAYARGQRLMPVIGGIFVSFAGLMVLITLLRAPVHRQREIEDRRFVAQAESVDPEDHPVRNFNYRQALLLGMYSFMILAPSILIGVLASAFVNNDIIHMNGLPTPARELWYLPIIVGLVGGLFVVLGAMGLLSFIFERIVWGRGEILWYDRLGRLKVRAPISSIVDVYEKETFVGRMTLVAIETDRGDIFFATTLPWADTVEALASQAAKDNR